MTFSKNQIIATLGLILCALPGIWLRDLSSVNELNYVTIAAEALARHEFFNFREASFAFPSLPPLYFWLCMIGHILEGGQASVFLLCINVLAGIFMLTLLERSFGSILLGNAGGSGAAIVLALPCFICAMFVAQPAYLSATLMVAIICCLAIRTHAVFTSLERLPYSLTLPILMCVLMLLSSIYAVLLPALVLAIVLFIKKRLGRFFTVIGYKTLLILFTVLILWFALTVLEGGFNYACMLFYRTPLAFFQGNLGHSASAFYPVWIFFLISLPLGPSAFYASLRIIMHSRSNCHVVFLFALLLPVVCIIALSLPSAKSELMLLPALPTLGYLIMYYLKEVRFRDELIRILLLLGMLPFSTLLLIGYYLNDELRVLNATAIICALLVITLFTLLAAIRLFYIGVFGGVATFATGILVTVMVLGFALPTVNAYISPLPAVRKVIALSSQSGIDTLCVIGIPKPWTLNLVGGNLKIRDSDKEKILSDDCAKSYRLLGRASLRAHTELDRLRRSEGAFVIGDNVLLEPVGQRHPQYWY